MAQLAISTPRPCRSPFFKRPPHPSRGLFIREGTPHVPASLCGLADRSDWLRNIHHTRTATIAADQPRRGMLMDACRAGGWGWGIFVQYSAGLILRARRWAACGEGKGGGYSRRLVPPDLSAQPILLSHTQLHRGRRWGVERSSARSCSVRSRSVRVDIYLTRLAFRKKG